MGRHHKFESQRYFEIVPLATYVICLPDKILYKVSLGEYIWVPILHI